MPDDDRQRFATARSTLLVDGFMTWFIKVGGLVVILAVFGILIFIAAQVVPLFQSARVEAKPPVTLAGAAEAIALGVDEWGEQPFVVDRGGRISFRSAADGAEVASHQLDLGGAAITAIDYEPRSHRLAVGTASGAFAVARIEHERLPAPGGGWRVTARVAQELRQDFAPSPITACAFGAAGGDRLAVIVQGRSVVLQPFVSKRVGIGRTAIAPADPIDISAEIRSEPVSVLVDERGESVLVATADGEIDYLFRQDGAFRLRQRFSPFADQADPAQRRVATMGYVLGDVSVVLTNAAGLTRRFSLSIPRASDGRPAGGERLFGQVAELEPLPGAPTAFAKSTRNKSVLIAGDRYARLIHATSGTERWAGELDFAVRHAVVGGKYDRLLLLDDRGGLHTYLLDDHHPEGGWNAVFGKLWYEGKSGPGYEWQSSGATDDFEPKLSMIPLLFGTLKATFYAMLISVPIALLAAIYVAEFMHPRFKVVIKPMVEVMASLPSVVLGFLAALWLAPLIEDMVPSVLCVLILLPAGSMAIGWLWTRMPIAWRVLVRPGYEFLAFAPVMLLLIWAAWSCGPLLESLVFTVPQAGGGETADFRLWWAALMSDSAAPFEQRNSLVVGFAMGFAVIPIIFTIAEDALSNVPKALRSGSLALGASRWQTAIRVVLPTASPGIFSALMIGLGRAIGETMIVVMATGNTPITEWNIFNGMRTISATIAVELPEAPKDGTLYRTLFLGALLLFALTFIINTAAELLRQHLRDKYKTV